MKKNILRVILIVLILIWMRMVFGFSNANAESSSSLSKRVAMLFSQKEEVIAVLEPIIRKIAHLSEYALGGFLIYGLFLTYNISSKKQIIFSALLGIFYAMTDEFHQLFIEGRSAQLKDVYIDSLGVILGICCLLFIVKIVEFIKRKG